MSIQSEALRAAVELEQRGHDYYADIAEHAGNPLTKVVFSTLADEELIHMERVRQLYGQTRAGEAPSLPHGSLENAVRRIFEHTEWGQRKAWEMDNAAAYSYATELEREAYALYSRLAESTGSAAEKEFFSRLQDEEIGHLTALQNVYNFLEHTGDWFASEENRVWNWMNT
jgi:rubrerythrin